MIESVLGKSVAANLSTGGTIDGDLTITGSLGIAGDASINLTSVVSNSTIIDATGTEALLVRKNADGGDVFLVDTTNSNAELTGDMKITNAEATIGLEIEQDGAGIALKVNQDANQKGIYVDTVVTTEEGIAIDANSLTTGKGLYVYSNASSTGTRNLVEMHSDNALATGATALRIQQDSTGSALTALGAAGSGSASGAVIKLQTAETTVVDGDYLGRIEFSAPSEASGTDAILAGAAIWAEADDTFAADNNSTELVFGTNTSAAYTERMRLTSDGKLGVGVTAPTGYIQISPPSGSDPTLYFSQYTSSTTGSLGEISFGNRAVDGQLAVIEAINDGATDSAALLFKTEATSGALAERMRITSAGLVGIGEVPSVANTVLTTQGQNVRFNAEGGETRFILNASNAGGDAVLKMHNNAQTLNVNIDAGSGKLYYTGGNLGIGTTSPAGSATISILDIENTTTNSTTEGGNLRLGANDGTVMVDTDRLGVIEFAGAEDTSSTMTVGARIEAVADATWSASENGADLVFYTTDGNASQGEVMRLTADGIGVISNTTSAPCLIVGSTDIDNSTDGWGGMLFGRTNTTATYNKAGIFFQRDGGDSSLRGDLIFAVDGAADSGNATITDAVMTLTHSGNVGIGTNAAPGNLLTVQGAGTAIASSVKNTTDGSSNYGQVRAESDSVVISMLATASSFSNSGAYHGAGGAMDSGGAGGIGILATHGSGTIRFATGGTAEKMRIDASGNVGIGVVPEASHASYTSVQIGGLSNIISTTAQSANSYTALANNAYIDGTPQWEYIITDEASVYKQTAGIHTFSSAASGSADAAITFTDVMKLDVNSRISLSNNDGGASNTLFGYLAGEDLASGGDQNTLIGHNVGKEITAADGIVGIGHGALVGGISPDAEFTVAIGHSALAALTSGIGNVAIGYQSLDANSASDFNTAVGHQALSGVNASGTQGNTAVGYRSGLAITSGLYNTLVGRASGLALIGGSANTFMGNYAGGNTTAAANCVVIGYIAANANMTTDANGTVAIGHSALTALTSGAGNTAVGYQALMAEDTGPYSTAIGHSALKIQDNANGMNTAVGYNSQISTAGGQLNTSVGNLSMQLIGGSSANNNVAIGNFSMQSSGTITDNVAANNTAVGADTLKAITTGLQNVAIGSSAGVGITTASKCVLLGSYAGDALTVSGAGSDGTVAVGYNALTALTSGHHNMAIGYQAGMTLSSEHYNVFIGYEAGKLSNGSYNTVLGHKAFDAVSSGAADNVAIGNNAMGGAIGAEVVDDCVAVGAEALSGALDSSGTDEASGTVAIGKSALAALTSGAGNVAIGYQAADSVGTGGNNTIVGYTALATANTAALNNTALGSGALGSASSSTTAGNIAIGMGALTGGSGDLTGCIAIGKTALDDTAGNDQTGTIAIGENALTALTSGERNVAIGFQALEDITEADDNVALGYLALNGSSNTGSNQNVAIGSYALDNMGSNASTKNTAVGHNSLGSLTSGDENCAFGRGSGTNILTGSSNTIIGNDSVSGATDSTNQTTLGFGVTGVADNSVTLGNASVTDVYAASDSGATVHAGGATLVAALGAEKVTNGTFTGNATGWTVTSGWAYSSNTMLKNGDSTTTLSQDTTEVAAEIYKVEYTISSHSVGSVTVSIGGVSGRTRTGDGTFVEYILATGTGNLTFTPSNTSRFTLDTVSAKKVGKGAADQINTWSADTGVSAGNAGLHIMAENGTMHVIGNKVGIGTLEPNQLLHTWAPSGDVKNYIQSNDSNDAQTQYANTSTTYSSGIQSNRYVIARHGDLADTNYQRLIIDGDGAVNMPNQPAFLAIAATDMLNFPLAETVTHKLDNEMFDQGGDFHSTVKTSAADATETNKLHDADGGFASGDVGSSVWNSTDSTYATVTGFTDSGELTLSADIMASGETYFLYKSTFTAPVTGKYQFSWAARLTNVDRAASYLNWYLETSNDLVAYSLAGGGSTDFGAFTYTENILIDMDANDTAKVSLRQSGGTKQVDAIGDASDNPYTFFSGYLVC